jgi:NADPH-dependent curcumin reductase CurA
LTAGTLVFSPGDTARGLLGVQRYGIVSGDDLEKIESEGEPLSYHLSIYGMTGLTAHFAKMFTGRHWGKLCISP